MTTAPGGRRAVFLDRDGVMNQAVVRDGKPHPPNCVEELVLVPGARAALDRLAAAGFVLLGVTNQPDVARGTQRREVVEAMNAWLLARLPVTEIAVCYHDDADGCDCRKPQPGALLRLAEQHGVTLARSFVIGDRWRDIEAGRRTGCRTVLIDYGYREDWPVAPPDVRVGSLAAAVDWVLAHAGT